MVILLILLLLAGPCWASTLTLDGVAIGMSYQQVLEARGLPKSVGEKEGVTYLIYPTPKSRPEGSTVWFHSDRVVFTTGYTLNKDSEPLFLYGMEGPVLEELFGSPQTLNVFAKWWPNSGIVLFGSNNIWPAETLGAPLGMRDPAFPIEWQERSEGRRWSKFEPWIDDQRIAWLADDVELGMAEERARKLAGQLEVVYQGGFVRAVRNPQSVLLSHQVGYHDFSVGFDLGESPQGLGQTPAYPLSGWYTPSPGGRVRMENGKIAEMQLELANQKLFQALSEFSQRP